MGRGAQKGRDKLSRRRWRGQGPSCCYGMQMLGLAIGRGGMQPDAAYTQNRWGKIGQGTYDVSAFCCLRGGAAGDRRGAQQRTQRRRQDDG